MLRFWPFILWLIYFIFPFDLFPDTLLGIGWIEDFLILALGYWMWRKKAPDYSADESDRFSAGQERARESAGNEYGNSDKYRHRAEARDPYRILGIERTATLEQIKHAYRLQANRYHPDKVSHLGEEFQNLAKEKFQDIQWAYDQLLKAYKAA